MIKKYFVFFSLLILFLVTIHPMPSWGNSKACNAITKGCVSNISDISIIDEELLQACKDCCNVSQVHVPKSVKSAFKGCTPRCKKSCEKAYKKAVAKLNKG